MPEPHFQALYDHYEEVIGMMPDEFASRDFILQLLQNHEGEFSNALKHYHGEHHASTAPVRQVISQLSQQLYEFPELVKHLGDADGPDIFGGPSWCAKWRKTNAA